MQVDLIVKYHYFWYNKAKGLILKNMKLAIIIPAYNEEKTIRDVLQSLPKKISGIDTIVSIVINDGSNDNTALIAKEYCDYLVNHVVNLGVGAATITGLEVVKKIDADIAVTIDADDQHNPNDILKLVKPIIKNDKDVVIGTRMLNSKGMPVLKVFGNWVMNMITYLVFHKWSTDSQSGLKSFSKKSIKKMSLHSMGYEICSEIIGEVQRNNLKYLEVPIEVKYSDYSNMKGQNWLNGVNILTKILAIKLVNKK